MQISELELRQAHVTRRELLNAPRHFCQNELFPETRGITKRLLDIKVSHKKHDVTPVLDEAHGNRAATLEVLLSALTESERAAIESLRKPDPQFTIERELGKFVALLQEVLSRAPSGFESQVLRKLSEQNSSILGPVRNAIDALQQAASEAWQAKPVDPNAAQTVLQEPATPK
ncbi:hypothetical protein HYZ99_00255 [Candidatus Peregrinibacteria bacterium]|nr:hypothetical protein [Candidatus Peregrinibacteria bacterium]